MKFGVREICDVVLKKKAPGAFGNLYLDKGMPVLYFDTLKTSSLEGAATTVYAQGGKGNPRLVAWEGDRTVTFTMEDALISPESFSILSGAGFMDASESKKLYVHTTEQIQIKDGTIKLSNIPSMDEADEGEMYIMTMTEDGAVDTYYLPMKVNKTHIASFDSTSMTLAIDTVIGKADAEGEAAENTWISDYNKDHADLIAKGVAKKAVRPSAETEAARWGEDQKLKIKDPLGNDRVVYVDYYVAADKGVKQIEIEAGKFGGSYYLEASTLFRDQATGDDFPAEFVIPNCKVQSNFTFTMAPTGDPSTFTFTMDAFPDYTKFDKTKKVIAALQIVEDRDTFGKAIDNKVGQ